MVANTFRAYGWASDRLRSFLVKGEPDLYATNGAVVLDIQAKERQNLNVNTVLQDLIEAQAILEEKHGFPRVATPVVVWRRMKRSEGKSRRRMQEGPIIIAMELEEFLIMLKGVNDE